MPQLIQTIDEYITTVTKKETHWIVFNKTYNDVHAYKKKLNSIDKYLVKEETNYKVQKEFLNFMQKELPEVEITQVFDFVSKNYLAYSYLGSYAINIDEGTPEYEKIIQKYETTDGMPKSNNAVIYKTSFNLAKKHYLERQEFLEDF